MENAQDAPPVTDGAGEAAPVADPVAPAAAPVPDVPTDEPDPREAAAVIAGVVEGLAGNALDTFLAGLEGKIENVRAHLPHARNGDVRAAGHALTALVDLVEAMIHGPNGAPGGRAH